MKFTCPKCKQKMNAPDRLSGKTCSCPRCSAKISIPVGPPPDNTETRSPAAAVNAKKGNWAPGEQVPRTGNYRCIYCGPEGLGATVLRQAMKTMGLPYTPPPSATKTPPKRFLNAGDIFPSCPNCKEDISGGDPTGWDFIEEKPASASMMPHAVEGDALRVWKINRPGVFGWVLLAIIVAGMLSGPGLGALLDLIFGKHNPDDPVHITVAVIYVLVFFVSMILAGVATGIFCWTRRKKYDAIHPRPAAHCVKPRQQVVVSLRELEAGASSDWEYWGEAQLLPCPHCKKEMERERLQMVMGGGDGQDIFSSLMAMAASYDTSKGGKHIEQKCDSCGKIFESRLAPDADALRHGKSFHQWRPKEKPSGNGG